MFKYGTARQDDVHNLLAEDELEMEFQQHNNSSSVIESDIGSQSPLSEVALSDNSQDGTHPSDDDDDEDEEGAVCFGVKRFVGLCIFLTSLSSCLLGYDIGIMAGAKRFIKKDLGFSGTQIEIILGSLNLVAAFGGLLSGKLADSIGRRKTLAFACTLFILGSGLMAFAESFDVMLIGRIVTGFAVGCGLTIAPLFGAELAPKSVRGSLVSLSEVAINLGILLGYVAGFAFSGLPTSVGWRWMLGVGAIPPVIILFLVFILPESPRWLVSRERHAEAAHVLRRTCFRQEARITLSLLQEEVKAQQMVKRSFRDQLWPEPHVRRLLYLGFAIAFFQQATGIESAIYYAPEIMEEAGITGEGTLLLANCGLGFVKLIFIFFPVAKLDKYGRKPFLLISAGGMAVAQFLIGMSFATNSSLALALFGQCLFMGSFSFGFGPVAWVLTSELFPLSVRGMGVGLATFVNRITSGTIALTFPMAARGTSTHAVFFFFTFVAGLAFWFCYKFVPETHGKTLEEIEVSMAEGYHSSRSLLGNGRGGSSSWRCCGDREGLASHTYSDVSASPSPSPSDPDAPERTHETSI
eukprot:m.192771 g.192771  ORF g.192771 m.192771 type:complete len:580 (-) comp25752_c0_seq3:82-1821(-)